MDFRRFIRQFPNNDIAARKYLESVLWRDGRFCPHCGSLNSWAIIGKSARAGLYQCADCTKQFTVTTKTPLHSTKLPLTTWIEAIYHVLMSSKGVSSVVLARLIGVSQKTAWKMGHAIREMMATRDIEPVLTGTVELDEKYLGGKPRPQQIAPDIMVQHKRGKGTDKQAIFVAVERHGEVRAVLIDNDSTATLAAATKAFVKPDAHLMTDQHKAYQAIAKDFAAHDYVNHGDKEYARQGIHNNTAESFNATLERAKIGVFHMISKLHMPRYVAEATFRWNQRKPLKTFKRGQPVIVMHPKPLMDRMAALVGVGYGRQLRRSFNGGLREAT